MAHFDALRAAKVRFISGCFCDGDQISQHAARRGDDGQGGVIGQHILSRSRSEYSEEEFPTGRVLLDVDWSLEVEFVEPIRIEPPEAFERTDGADQDNADAALSKRRDVLLDELRKSLAIRRSI